MHFLAFRDGGRLGLAASNDGTTYRGLREGDGQYPGSLDQLIRQTPAQQAAAASALLGGQPVDPAKVDVLQPLRSPGKIICVGLNYRDHAAESGFQPPELSDAVREVFIEPDRSLRSRWFVPLRRTSSTTRASSSPLSARAAGTSASLSPSTTSPAIRSSTTARSATFSGVAPQWTLGKNFDGTGAFGPVFVTADALPPGATGLRIETRLNGSVMQSASTDDLIFDVATLVAEISVAMTLETGDLIVTGTPSGVGAARKPPVFMKAGDVCEVEIERIGVLRSRVDRPIVDLIARDRFRETSMAERDETQVLVVGAGPVGLSLAIELGLRGIEVTAGRAARRAPGPQPRAKTTNVRSMTHMRRWGIADALRAAAPLAARLSDRHRLRDDTVRPRARGDRERVRGRKAAATRAFPSPRSGCRSTSSKRSCTRRSRGCHRSATCRRPRSKA